MSTDLNLDIFEILHQERNTFGLRSGDYDRYNKHLSSRLAKLRASLGLQYSSGGGNGAKVKPFKKAEVLKPEEVKDVRYLEMVLLEAERAHTTSLALHQAWLQTPSDRRTSAQMHRVRMRSQRSLFHSGNLYALLIALPAEASVRLQTIAQAKINHLLLQAIHLHLFRESFMDALPLFIVTRQLLLALADVHAAESGRKEALALGWVDEQVDPRIRYGAWKLGRRSDSASEGVEGIVADFEDEMDGLLEDQGVKAMLEDLKKLKASSTRIEQGPAFGGERKISWLGEEIEVRNPDIVSSLSKVSKALARLDEFEGRKKAGKQRGGKMKAFDRALGSLGEAVGVVQRILDESQTNAQNSTNSTSQASTLPILLDYLQHILLTQRITRDLVLIRAILRPFPDPVPHHLSSPHVNALSSQTPAQKEIFMRALPGILKLYDSVIGSFEKIRVLQTIEKARIQPTDGEDEEVEVGECIEKKIAFYRAKRIGYLSTLHYLLSSVSTSSTSSSGATSTSLVQALLLLSRASLLLRQIHGLPSTYPSDLTPLSEDDVTALERSVGQLESVVKVSLWESTQDEGEEKTFLDLAFNFVELERGDDQPEDGELVKPETKSSVATKNEKAQDEEEEEHGVEDEEEIANGEPKKKGWLGGWFGRN
ncbi:Signal recognition particle, subunit Srp68 [Phaffia rhodozyma]|uniref:Signal recognition particle subunit SRP68 n=1 Tax=Phaffia rhodozyma TaxID=264483 RepID=A0A0F7STF3_PHARH|nr:Signal recognition particle, subunit Srp68 [Phaffia rhodozyma]